MPTLNSHPAGRHLLQTPGPSPVPDRILRSIGLQTIDHRGPEFAALGLKVLEGVRHLFQTGHPVAVFPATGTGAWEAALANTLSPGDPVLMYETGHFATLWQQMARRLGLEPEFLAAPGSCPETGLPSAWRRGVDAELVEQRLRADRQHRLKAVCVVHNETSTGVTSDIAAVRRALDAAGHPALLLVDTVSGLGAADYRHDEWGVDVAVSGSQKGLMLPPGLGFNALSPKALDASRRARLPRSFWAWDQILAANRDGYWPSTPNINLLYGLAEAIDMMLGEGLDAVFARHLRLAAACRAAVQAWGLTTQCVDTACHSPALTAVVAPAAVDADELRALIHARFNLSLGAGLGRLKGRVFRIGHLGDCNELTLLAALAGCEMGLRLAGVRLAACGVDAAMELLQASTLPAARPLR
jgi:alanine-glyoxylate transaminase/serine-glyoxylate transaminase/serine-pyruvate transaminase